jgi:hypothetical protein
MCQNIRPGLTRPLALAKALYSNDKKRGRRHWHLMK